MKARRHERPLALGGDLGRRRVVLFGVTLVGRSGLDPHRAVEVYRQTRDATRLLELSQDVQKILSATDGEGRDEQPSPDVGRALHRLDDDWRRVTGRMQPVAVGG